MPVDLDELAVVLADPVRRAKLVDDLRRDADAIEALPDDYNADSAQPEGDCFVLACVFRSD